jgi:hypothetical protein
MAEHMRPDGRRLISGGDPQFEIAADIRTFRVREDGWERELTCVVTRTWCQKPQKFVVTATTTGGHLAGHVRSATYKDALSMLREQIEG